MTKSDLLRLGAAALWDGVSPRLPGQPQHPDEAISYVAKMTGGSDTIKRELIRVIKQRLHPHTAMREWMAAAKPNVKPPTMAQAQAHTKEWFLRMAGPAPAPTPQAYTPRRRRR